MKKVILCGAALLAASPVLLAQSLTITAPGYSTAKLFDATAGFTIAGLAASPNGDVFYIESDSSFSTPAASKLYRRSAGDGYASATTLFDFGSAVFGSFVLWDSGKVYFGENSTGVIRAVNTDLSIDLLGTVAGNYDAVFSGGSLFLSHNPGGFTPLNKVSRFTLDPDGGGGLALSAADLILDTPNDYSGPIDFDAAGNLFYGGSGSFGRTDLHRYSAAEVAGAFGAGTTLTLDAPHLYLANGGNAYLAFDGAALWQSAFTSLNRIDVTTPVSAEIGTSTDSIGHLDEVGGTLYVNITKASFDGSAVYAVVPEPTSTLLLALGLASFTIRRRRGQG